MRKLVERFMGLFLSPKKIEEPVIGRWWGSAYITWFKEELELIATLLSCPTDTILVQFNLDDSVVRYLNKREEVIATVKVQGEMGCATDMTIITNLSEEQKEIFVKNLTDLRSLENPERPRRIKIYFRELDAWLM
jgi:hypothetical protein